MVGDGCCCRRSQKLLHNEQHVSWSIVMMRSPGIVAQLVWMFVPDIFPQLPQNVAIEFSCQRLSWWIIFLIDDAFIVNKSTLI
jgi:hypothetical protein